MFDREDLEIRRLLSRPAADVTGQVSRRRFLLGATASAGALASLPSFLDPFSAQAAPLRSGEKILVVLHLGGGNDGLDTVIPRADGRYRKLRGPLAVTDALTLDDHTGLHPSLPKLKERFDAGHVAILQGVGQTGDDHSHFSSTASWMAGTAGADRTTGWLGRWLDAVPDAAAGLRAVTIGASIPLHLQGRRSVITAIDPDSAPFGADRSDRGDRAIFDTVSAFAATSTDHGALGDALARSGASSIALAADVAPRLKPTLPDDSLASQLTLAARLINADLGVQVLNVELGSFDTHNDQTERHEGLLAELDAGIDAFYRQLDPERTGEVALMSFSEFGRRAAANASGGTDHGAGSVLFVIGDRVNGGLHGEAPRLDKLTSRGDVAVTLDFRSAYASVLGPWLGGDAREVLGAEYEDLRLFR